MKAIEDHDIAESVSEQIASDKHFKEAIYGYITGQVTSLQFLEFFEDYCENFQEEFTRNFLLAKAKKTNTLQ